MASYNQNYLGILIIVSLGILIIIILIRRGFIKYYQYQITILRGVMNEVDEILSELPGEEGVRITFIFPHGRLVDGHPSPITSFLSPNIARLYGIYYTIITTLELEAPILLQ